MPVYEFYCRYCNTVYKFFSRTVNTEKVPLCPSCKDVPLTRRMSVFAVSSATQADDSRDTDMPAIDEAKMEKAMTALAREAEKIDEEDPRQAAQLMRKLASATGLKIGAGMEEALNRLEQGEDPDKIEEEMGEFLEGEDPFLPEEKPGRGARKPPPRVDDTIYDL